MAFCDMAILWVLGSQMVNLGQIDFSLGLHLKFSVIDGQNKFEVHISIDMAKIANLQSKMQ